MDERDGRRNRRIWAAIFSAVALGLLTYGIASREWPTILVTTLVSTLNVVGVVQLLRDRR